MQVPDFVTGSIAPTFTAFTETGALDDASQRNLLDYMLQAGGVSAFFVRSGMGQMYTFSVDEVKQLAKNACAHLSGKAPVLVGCSGEWDRDRSNLPDPKTYVAQGIELCKYSQDIGADGVVVTIPEGLRPAGGQSIEDLVYEYITTIANATTLPVFIYQPPGTDEKFISSPETIARLADIDNVVAMKASTSDAGYICDALYATRGKDFSYIVGAEMAYFAGLYAGGRACIGQGASVNPKVLNAVRDRFDANDAAGAVQAQWDVNFLVREVTNSVEFFKRYCTEKGFPIACLAGRGGSNPYGMQQAAWTDEAYAASKAVYEEVLARY